MASQEKISVHSLAGKQLPQSTNCLSERSSNQSKKKAILTPSSDLKNTSDDALPNYLNSLNFKQSHTLSDTRLAIGYAAFAICAATFYWDYTYGWDSTKYYTTIAVALYTTLNGILTFWIFYVEKGTVYIGTLPSGERISISSSTTKHVPLYKLKIITWSGKQAPGLTKQLVKPFAEWFDEKGHFIAKPFQQMLASNVAILGKLDPKNVVSEKKKKVVETVDDGKTMDEKWASLLEDSKVENETSTPTKAKRRVKGNK